MKYAKIENPEIIQKYKDYLKALQEWRKVYHEYAQKEGFLSARFYRNFENLVFTSEFRLSLLKENQDKVDFSKFKRTFNSFYTYKVAQVGKIKELNDFIEKNGKTFNLMKRYEIILGYELNGFNYNLSPIGQVTIHEHDGVERLMVEVHEIWSNHKDWFKEGHNLEFILKSEYYRLMGQ